MEGNRRIVLYEPGADTGDNPSGEMQMRPSKAHVVYAVRRDRDTVGDGLLGTNIVGGQWKRHYTFREKSVNGIPNESWSLEDEEGVPLKIEGVFEKTSGPWARYITIVCERIRPA